MVFFLFLFYFDFIKWKIPNDPYPLTVLSKKSLFSNRHFYEKTKARNLTSPINIYLENFASLKGMPQWHLFLYSIFWNFILWIEKENPANVWNLQLWPPFSPVSKQNLPSSDECLSLRNISYHSFNHSTIVPLCQMRLSLVNFHWFSYNKTIILKSISIF